MVKQKRATLTRQALIRSAAEVFAEAGYAEAALGAISRGAGVSAGALHFHFPSKLALAESVMREAAATMDRVRQCARSASDDPVQQVIDSAFLLVERLDRDPVLRGGFTLDADVQTHFDIGLRRTWRRWLEDALSRAEAAGRLAPGVRVSDAARIVLAVTVAYETFYDDGPGSSERRVAAFWALLLPGLLADAGDAAQLRTETGPRYTAAADDRRKPGQDRP